MLFHVNRIKQKERNISEYGKTAGFTSILLYHIEICCYLLRLSRNIRYSVLKLSGREQTHASIY